MWGQQSGITSEGLANYAAQMQQAQRVQAYSSQSMVRPIGNQTSVDPSVQQLLSLFGPQTQQPSQYSYRPQFYQGTYPGSQSYHGRIKSVKKIPRGYVVDPGSGLLVRYEGASSAFGDAIMFVKSRFSRSRSRFSNFSEESAWRRLDSDGIPLHARGAIYERFRSAVFELTGYGSDRMRKEEAFPEAVKQAAMVAMNVANTVSEFVGSWYNWAVDKPNNTTSVFTEKARQESRGMRSGKSGKSGWFGTKSGLQTADTDSRPTGAYRTWWNRRKSEDGTTARRRGQSSGLSSTFGKYTSVFKRQQPNIGKRPPLIL